MIYYKLNGKYYIRSVHERVNQHPASKATSTNLSIASGLGKRLRLLLEPVLPVKKTKAMQNRFGASIMCWLNRKNPQPIPAGGEIPCLQNFLFNEATGIRERWKIDMQVIRNSNRLQHLYLL